MSESSSSRTVHFISGLSDLMLELRNRIIPATRPPPPRRQPQGASLQRRPADRGTARRVSARLGSARLGGTAPQPRGAPPPARLQRRGPPLRQPAPRSPAAASSYTPPPPPPPPAMGRKGQRTPWVWGSPCVTGQRPLSCEGNRAATHGCAGGPNAALPSGKDKAKITRQDGCAVREYERTQSNFI